MAVKQGDVVFKAGESVNLEEFWDDSALIKAYDKAVNSFKYGSTKDPVENSSDKKKNRRKRKKNKRESKESCDEFEENLASASNWTVGDKCQAVFSEDGLVYNAEIINIYEPSLNTCVVRYTDYGNEEEQYLTDLIPWTETTCNNGHSKNEQNNVQVKNYKSETGNSNTHNNPEWHVSDICTAPELPNHHLHEAVINSFPSQFTCKVTFIRSRKSQEVDIKDIQRADHHRHHHEHNHDSARHFNPPYPPMYPYPPPQMINYPYHPFQTPQYPMTMPPFNRQWPPTRNPEESTARNKGIPRAPVPPPPPPMSFDDLHNDDETLASMLMSWYLSGYHTGYFKATQQFRSGSCNNIETATTSSKGGNECEPTATTKDFVPKQTTMDTKE